jgi:hypothetical protein
MLSACNCTQHLASLDSDIYGLLVNGPLSPAQRQILFVELTIGEMFGQQNGHLRVIGELAWIPTSTSRELEQLLS